METLLEYFKGYDSISDPELKLSLDTMKRLSGATRLEDVSWYWESKKEVRLPTTNIANLEPFQYLNLAYEMVLFGNRISDIKPLVNLTNLQHLNLIDNNIVFLDGINTLKANELYLGNNSISNASPLANMSSLKVLGLKNNQIKDLEPLESLTGLTQLNLSGNPLDNRQVQALRGKLPGCRVMF